ncbi:MAG: M20/M25/M40 family metallo-hydrolase, partial [Firmicutes bacterium]|nr:M20/M25/M40 family metallo-hydrolase [Candidatus Caballimonas caccae]
LDYFFYDKANIFKMQNEQGDITFSPDLIEEKEDGIYLKVDCRFPYPFTEKDVKQKFDEFGFEYKLEVKHGTQFVEKDSFLVEKLMGAYNEVMKENLTPISQSGSTFARVFEKGVAFGPEFPSKPSTIHEPNECVAISDLEKMYEIYKKAIFELAK